MTDEQIAREREIYDGLVWSAYNELIYSQKFLNSDIAGRASMISKMQEKLGIAASTQLGDELRAAGFTSVLEDNSDVPEQPVGLSPESQVNQSPLMSDELIRGQFLFAAVAILFFLCCTHRQKRVQHGCNIKIGKVFPNTGNMFPNCCRVQRR